MRGKVVSLWELRKSPGITPAYAGKSLSPNYRPDVTGDHPRLCGEKAGENHVEFVLEGSPPPMRGKGSVDFPCSIHDGITPAYAGKRFILTKNIDVGGDHPRLCGEKSDMLEKITWNLGSPPPMRGKGEYKA